MFGRENPKRIRNIAMICSCAVVAIIVIGLLVTSIYYRNRWYPNTKINGINVSGMKYSDSKDVFHEHIQSYSLHIKGRDNASLQIDSSMIDLNANVDEKLQEIYDKEKQGFFLFHFGKAEYEEEFSVSYNKDKLNKIISESVMVKGDKTFTIKKPQNAYVTYDESKGYGEIVPEDSGNTIIEEELKKVVTNALIHMDEQVDLTDEKTYPDVYQKPSLTSNDQQIQQQKDSYNSYLLNWVSWDMGEDTIETIEPKDIKEWLKITKKGKVKFSKAAMSEWVEKLCLKYKTVGKTRKFKTHDGKKIKVSGGDYGWRMDYKKTVNQAYKAITKNNNAADQNAYLENATEEGKEKLTTNLKPIYEETAFKKDYENFTNDWDKKNYSEVDLTNQMVYVYKNGKLAYSSVCVTGLDSDPERRTRTGCYDIKDKKEEYVLTGADYSTPTKYWVRIMWTGTGYHYLARSDWSRWSPQIYKYRGSHGCINLQLEDARNIYNLVKLGDAVFIHY